MTRPYTVIYAVTRDLGDAVPQHECYHHLRRVWALHDQDALDLCKDDALPGFVFQRLVVLEGHPEIMNLGKKCLVHEQILGAASA